MNDLVGRTLAGRYRIDAFLGRGGMAEVYQAWDQQRMTHLALKALRGDLAEDAAFLRRFRREARVLEALQHPNIVRFYGLEEDGALAFMLMDWIDGVSLRRVIFERKSPLPPEAVLAVLRPACSALHFAHGLGVIHSDVKPANVMLDRRGGVFVADFGIARLAESATATMAAAGTPAYMAPEQCRGEPVDARTDLYALGILLFEMVTGGERPFMGDSAGTTGSTYEKVRWEQLNAPPPSPREFNPRVSPGLEAVILRCLQKDPAARFPSAQALWEAAAEALPGIAPDVSVMLGPFAPASPPPADRTLPTIPPGMDRTSVTQAPIAVTAPTLPPLELTSATLPPAAPPVPAPAAKPRRGGGVVWTLVVLIVLGLLGTGGYFMWQAQTRAAQLAMTATAEALQAAQAATEVQRAAEATAFAESANATQAAFVAAVTATLGAEQTAEAAANQAATAAANASATAAANVTGTAVAGAATAQAAATQTAAALLEQTQTTESALQTATSQARQTATARARLTATAQAQSFPVSTTPVLGSVSFPASVPLGQSQSGSVTFRDGEGDINRITFEVVQQPSNTSYQGFSYNPVTTGNLYGTAKQGQIVFQMSGSANADVRFRVTLHDAAGHSSNAVEFTVRFGSGG